MTSANSYIKMKDGSWGVRISSGNVKPGSSWLVTKKSGGTASEKVDKVVWKGGGVSLCTICAKAKAAHASGTCTVCGGRLSAWEKSHGVRRCSNCRDGGGNARGGHSYTDRHGNFVLGDDD